MDIEEAKDGLKILTEPSEGGLTRLFSQKGIDAIEHLQAENAKLKSELEEVRKDAERYQALRGMHWTDGKLAVVATKNLVPGMRTYSGDLLDAEIAARQQKG